MPAIVSANESSSSSRAHRARSPVVTARHEWTSQGLASGLTGFLEEVGDVALFALRGISGATRRVGWHALVPVSYAVGVGSVPVVAFGGLCIGMILAVQAYCQLHAYALETCLSAIIVNAMVRGLGPLLSAILFVARVGSAMTADLATLRTTKQIAALAERGVDSVHSLVTPRLLAGLLMAPLLTILAYAMGILGGGLVCIGVEAHSYWQHTGGASKCGT
jgi:phospholipid/cholesterol/gamma-HCH transport system permease protein